MKNVFLILFLVLFISPAFAFETSAQGYEATRYFHSPHDARFKYDLPSNLSMPFSKDKSVSPDDDAEITLDENDIKPVKKVIKKLENGSGEAGLNPKDTPMNYDSFPKFYDNNDMIQQQFMPMF